MAKVEETRGDLSHTSFREGTTAVPRIADPIEIRNITHLPKDWGTPLSLQPQHPVMFRESQPGENYEYYGRQASPEHLIARRWQGGDKWKDASPVLRDEMKATYRESTPAERSALGIAAEGLVYFKQEETRVVFVPNGSEAIIHTAENSTEKIVGSADAMPTDAIAFDTEGRPYKFPYKKNMTAQGELPAAYVAK